jgi:hypothetical protein
LNDKERRGMNIVDKELYAEVEKLMKEPEAGNEEEWDDDSDGYEDDGDDGNWGEENSFH